MLPRWFSRFWRTVPFSVLLAGIPILLILSVSGSAQGKLAQQDLMVEVVLPGDTRPAERVFVWNILHGTYIPRQILKINDPAAAGEFSALYLRTDVEGNAIRLTLSIVYPDPSNQVDKDFSNRERGNAGIQKVVGSFLMREGESLRLAELDRFGIEAFEVKAISSKTVVFKPGEGPRIVNNTTALEVSRLEKDLRNYELWLKNISGKNVVAYTISAGNTSVSAQAEWFGDTRAAIPAGATTEDGLPLDARQVESHGITIQVAVFEDGSFEGDPKLAAQFSAKMEGVKIQAPHVLRKIEETLLADDAALRAAFDKLEAELWEIPEALDKPSALEFLKTKFPSLDETTLSALYEDFKGGLYDARNIALSSLGSNRQYLRDRAQYDNSASTAKSLRGTLEDLKQTFEKINAVQR